jgi:hypothetical protein
MRHHSYFGSGALAAAAAMLATPADLRAAQNTAGEWVQNAAGQIVGYQGAGGIHASGDPVLLNDAAGSYLVGGISAGAALRPMVSPQALALAHPQAHPALSPMVHQIQAMPGSTMQHPMFTAPVTQGTVVQYTPFEATAPRKLPLGGFRATVFAANPVVNISNQPQIPFRTERLVVPSNVGVDFDITDLKVGNVSQFVASGNVPGLTFSEQAFQVELKGDTAYISQTVTVQVQNLSGLDKSFACTIIGIAVRGNLSSFSGGSRVFAPRFVIADFDGERNPRASKAYLRILCDALVSLNLIYLQDHPATPSLYETGIRYVRDPVPVEDWQTIPELLYRGCGDCKSLACYRVAELLRQGVKAIVQFRWRGNGNRATFHIQVQLPDGTIEDPSKILGMRGTE